MSDFTRRTVVRGAAWTVPVVAVAANAPAFATSYDPPPPVINFGGSCGNTGALQKGCGGFKTLEVPLSLTNPGATPIIFQVTSMYTCNCGTAPTGPGDGVAVGIRGLWSTPSHSVPDQNNCTAVPTVSACSNVSGVLVGEQTGGSILVPAGTTTPLRFWIESKSLGDSSIFSSRIGWRILDATTCAILRTGEAFTTTAIQPANCDG